jgi:hypothetical protein
VTPSDGDWETAGSIRVLITKLAGHLPSVFRHDELGDQYINAAERGFEMHENVVAFSACRQELNSLYPTLEAG